MIGTPEVAAAVLVLVLAQAVIIAALWIQRSRQRESEARITAILHAAPDLMFLQTRDGVYLDYYAPERNRLLIPPEQFIGRNMRDVLPASVLERVASAFADVWKSDQPVVVEYVIPLDRTQRHYEARLVRCGHDKVLSVVRDITDRKRTEAALVASEQRYAMATAAGRVGVWDWNLFTHELYVDPWLKRSLGFEDHELADTLEDWSRHLHPDDLPVALARAENHINGLTPTYDAEFRVLTKDGTARWLVSRGSVVLEGGRPVRMVGTYTDITEERTTDEALRHAQAEVDRMSRLAAFGEFAASIAHEVSQPLTAIVMNARACLRWLAHPVPDLSETRAALVEVVDAGKRADEIIKRNRELFRRHIVEKRPVDVNGLVLEVSALTGARMRAHAMKLQTRLERDLAPVLGDRLELCQVLLNLVANAIDSMHAVDENARVIVITTTAGERAPHEVEIAVRDAGVGLAGVDLDRMFTTGYTTKARGTGMGLSICRTIIEAHGGRIGVRANDDGAGATFFFTLPTADAQKKGSGGGWATASNGAYGPGQLVAPPKNDRRR